MSQKFAFHQLISFFSFLSSKCFMIFSRNVFLFRVSDSKYLKIFSNFHFPILKIYLELNLIYRDEKVLRNVPINLFIWESLKENITDEVAWCWKLIIYIITLLILVRIYKVYLRDIHVKYSDNQKTVKYEVDVVTVLKCIVCCYNAKRFTKH